MLCRYLINYKFNWIQLIIYKIKIINIVSLCKVITLSHYFDDNLLNIKQIVVIIIHKRFKLILSVSKINFKIIVIYFI